VERTRPRVPVKNLMTNTEKELVKTAMNTRERAHAPYSNFKVGAAIQTKDGKIYSGCNIENATYGLTICAERTAIFKAISEGEKEFAEIAVIADTDELTPPCGACRQIIWEFCGDIPVILTNLQGKSEIVQMSELFPRAFDVKFLK
jgi:cytidine deaminase